MSATLQPSAVSIRVEEQRRAALQATIARIARHGYDGVRVRDVAADAQLSVGLLQHYFETREALLAQALEHHCATLISAWPVPASAPADPWRRLVDVVGRIGLNPAVELRAAIWTELAAAAVRHEELREPFDRAYGAWRELVTGIIEDGVDAGTFAPTMLVRDTVELLLAAIDGALVAIAGGTGAMTGPRLEALVLAAARQLLGVPAPAPAGGSQP